jgi:hypothetical protein
MAGARGRDRGVAVDPGSLVVAGLVVSVLLERASRTGCVGWAIMAPWTC